jgi:parallel beta-helix repeat protein
MGGRCTCILACLRGVFKSCVLQRAITTTMIALLSIAVGSNDKAIAATVTLSPRDNIQNEVNNNPAGTTFVLQPGTYQRQSVNSLKNGDSFIGQTGAILNGAKVLTGWTQVAIKGALYWTTAGGTPLPTPYNTCNSGPVSCCLPGYYPACTYVQDLDIDNVEYQHVTSLANVVAGKSWYYDFSGTDGGVLNNVYLAAGDNPNSKTVELGDTTDAFEGAASNITIENLTIEKYAAPIGTAVVQIYGSHWLLNNNVITLNHGEGITTKPGGDYVKVISSTISRNGESGVGDPADYGRWSYNTLAYNDTDGVSTDFSGSGGKFTGSNIMVNDNISHNNVGCGLHGDGGATYITFDHNTVYNNTTNGIRYETSSHGTITNNTAYSNAYGYGAQIVYTGSDYGTISGNLVIDNGYGAIDVTNSVGARPGAYTVTGTQVTGNTIWLSSTQNDVAVDFEDRAQPPEPRIFTDPTNFFDYNTYKFSLGYGRSSWLWGETIDYFTPISWASWRGDGQDPHGTVTFNDPPPF